MRRVLLALLVLTTAAPALAGQARIPTAPKPKPAAVAQTPIATPSFVLPAPIPLAVGRPGGDVTQCKATCARTLYFCHSAGDDDSCGGRWAQCNAACTATYSPARVGR
ncbi:hypothetical protein EIB18_04160 [Caulobacter vibrioides]|uniref:hypothetical protein n=1 Tax=Caulobacter vibrioides TaxID=155892 RepID=UPI000BB4C9E1|nr:hypothetical protein [Caulobacter vibrioides]ATC23746.1 hypothetical protein CA608_03955 [Caulobacter vibrioides]AZH11984.1 hypothetical protein EIB18_04160 [Caulobacter vibrioides]PLR15437.1 hypothetical protein CVUC_02875 [Caulobacter vibrioides]